MADRYNAIAKVLELDAECGMAHWGTSIMSMSNLFTWPSNVEHDLAPEPKLASSAPFESCRPRRCRGCRRC